jgi:hypothetical protein
MALERNPNDPYRADPGHAELARRRADQIDAELQADPELAEGPASGGRIALFAIALVAILGVIFYGLNSPTTSPGPTPTAQTTPASPSGTAMAPRAPAGQTTGSSMTPAQPAPPPAANTPAPAPQNTAPATGAPSSN